MTFWDHLEELRLRIIRSIAYVGVASIAGWVFRDPLLQFLEWPAKLGAERAGLPLPKFLILDPVSGLVLMMQVALVAGVVLACPFLVREFWGFFEPALEEHERKWAVPFVLLATILFLAGCGFCYLITPQCLAFIFRFNAGIGAESSFTLEKYLYFIMRFLLVMGVGFEIPLVLMIGGVVGLIDSKMMSKHWQYGTLAIFIVAAVVTPTTEPVLCTLVGILMASLYPLSIFLVKLVERYRPRREESEETPDAEAVEEDPYHIYDEINKQRDAESEGLSEPPTDPPVTLDR